jgi:hypothetical protein
MHIVSFLLLSYTIEFFLTPAILSLRPRVELTTMGAFLHGPEGVREYASEVKRKFVNELENSFKKFLGNGFSRHWRFFLEKSQNPPKQISFA